MYVTIYLLDLFILLMAMDFDRLCKDILGLESKIRFVGVCDDSGEIKSGGQREGIPESSISRGNEKIKFAGHSQMGFKGLLLILAVHI